MKTRLNLLSLLSLVVCLSVSAKTHTEGIYLYTTLDDNTCKVEQADPTVKITEKTIEIPATVSIDGKDYRVTEIPANGFKCNGSNYNVTAINLPEGLLSIGENAFENYLKVTSLTIPNTLTEISAGAFKYANGLKTVTIGAGLRLIPAKTFERAGNISEVIMRSAEPPVLEDQAFALPFFITLKVPVGSKDAYAAASGWKDFQTIVEEGTAVIDVPRPEISMDDKNMVSMTCSDSRASIYYTFGTVSPTKTNGTLYTSPFLLKEKATVRAKAFIEDFQSPEAHADLEPRAAVSLPDSLIVFLNGHTAWAADKNMAWHSYPVAEDGESSRVSDILGNACVWAEPHGDLLYMFNFDSFSSDPEYYLTTYDWGTLEFVGQEPLPNDFIANDLAVDPVTGNIYGVFTRNYEYYFGYINLETKTRTNVARYDLMYNESTVDRVMALCFSPEGVAYGLTFGGRLVKFDRETGAYSVVGETKWNINYVSCARWDEKSGQIVYAFSDQDGKHYLYTINPETAERSKYADVPGSISAFFTPYDYVKQQAPSRPQNVKLSFNKGTRSGKLSFKAPDVAQNGDEISGNLNYRVVRKGKTVAEGTVRAGGMADVDINSTMDGNYVCSVVLSNNYGESIRTKVSAFSGQDAPATPAVHAEKTEEGIRVEWNAIETGANGGYIDPSTITYTVVRYPGKETVASRITDTYYVDKLPAPENGKVQQYYYTVTAWTGETASSAGKSNKIVLGYFTPTWTETFDKEESLDNFTIINNSGYYYSDEGDTSGWGWNNYWRCAGAFYHPYSSLDDWLITPPMMMEKGKTYRLTFKAGSYPDRTKNYLEVCYGTDNVEASMTNVLLEKFNVQSENQKGDWMNTYTVDIIPNEDGLHYVGFHCLSEADQLWLYLDDVNILEGIVAGAPKAVDDLTIEPDENGVPKAEISFTLPTQTVDDKKIEDVLKAEIRRGDLVVYSEQNQTPGSKISFVDEVGVHGNQTYSVRAYSGEIPGMEILSTIFVGNTRPLSPVEVTAAENPDKYGEVTISWIAPEKDERGRGIAPENLTYEIEYAWDNGQTGTLVSGIKDTSYTYVPKQSTDKEQFVTYMVSAFTPYGKNNVGNRTKEQIPVGAPYKAPWSESFVSPLAAPMGMSLINGTTSCGWGGYNDSDGIDSQDGDNCFAGFRGIAEGNAGSLYTGKLDLSDLTDPELSYWIYKMGPEDINTLELSVGGFGEWESLDLTSMDQIEEGWNKITIPMTDYAGRTIQIKWVATVKLYSYVLLDNISLKSTGTIPDSVDEIDGGKEPLSTRFFTMEGLEIKAPVPGNCYIVVTTYSDGTTSSRKLMSK